jgi:ribosome-associated protein
MVLEVGDIIGITDYFVITSGANTRQVKTIVEEVERQMKELGVRPTAVEGLSDATWILMDFGGFIVHVFLAETRAYYGLERLWGDAPDVNWEDVAAAVS